MYKGEFSRLSGIISSLRLKYKGLEKDIAGSAMAVIGKEALPTRNPASLWVAVRRDAVSLFGQQGHQQRIHFSTLVSSSRRTSAQNPCAELSTLFAPPRLHRELSHGQDHP